MEREELTADEVRVASQALGLSIQGKGFAPLPAYLPACESLRERGWLARRMLDGRATYQLTPTARTALELAGLSDPERVSVN